MLNNLNDLSEDELIISYNDFLFKYKYYMFNKKKKKIYFNKTNLKIANNIFTWFDDKDNIYINDTSNINNISFIKTQKLNKLLLLKKINNKYFSYEDNGKYFHIYLNQKDNICIAYVIIYELYPLYIKKTNNILFFDKESKNYICEYICSDEQMNNIFDSMNMTENESIYKKIINYSKYTFKDFIHRIGLLEEFKENVFFSMPEINNYQLFYPILNENDFVIYKNNIFNDEIKCNESYFTGEGNYKDYINVAYTKFLYPINIKTGELELINYRLIYEDLDCKIYHKFCENNRNENKYNNDLIFIKQNNNYCISMNPKKYYNRYEILQKLK